MAAESRKNTVREPVQVYLTPEDRKLLKEVAVASGISGAEVLRRGLRRMAGEVLADSNPAMQLLEEMNAAEWPADMPPDVGASHERYLAEEYSPPKPKGRRK